MILNHSKTIRIVVGIVVIATAHNIANDWLHVH